MLQITNTSQINGQNAWNCFLHQYVFATTVVPTSNPAFVFNISIICYYLLSIVQLSIGKYKKKNTEEK